MILTDELKEKFSNLSVLVVGDMYLDIDYIGGYSGYSRESEQLPIFRANEVKTSPGGGGNLAVCFATLGVKTTVCGYRGNTHDTNWQALEQCFHNHGIATIGMKFAGRTQTFGKCYLHNGQHIYRIDLVDNAIPEHKRQSLVDIIPFLASHNAFVACADYDEVNEYGVCSKEVIEAVRANAKVKFATSRSHICNFYGFDHIIQNENEIKCQQTTVTMWQDLVETNGGKGATHMKHNGDGLNPDIIRTFVPSKELTGAIDPCGCGDMFYAIYASSVMAGYDTTTCLQLANAGARCVARKLFGTGQADCDEIAKEWKVLYG